MFFAILEMYKRFDMFGYKPVEGWDGQQPQSRNRVRDRHQMN